MNDTSEYFLWDAGNQIGERCVGLLKTEISKTDHFLKLMSKTGIGGLLLKLYNAKQIHYNRDFKCSENCKVFFSCIITSKNIPDIFTKENPI